MTDSQFVQLDALGNAVGLTKPDGTVTNTIAGAGAAVGRSGGMDERRGGAEHACGWGEGDAVTRQTRRSSTMCGRSGTTRQIGGFLSEDAFGELVRRSVDGAVDRHFVTDRAGSSS
ncbi:MAG: hypothetical protein ACT4OZ_15010 [Gemmatimonadota bacterium]